LLHVSAFARYPYVVIQLSRKVLFGTRPILVPSENETGYMLKMETVVGVPDTFCLLGKFFLTYIFRL